jgi:ABC-type transporter Mla subunit MlaD
MKNIKSSVSFFLIILVTLIPINVLADVFGTDDETWERVFVDLKKINSRLVKLETSELISLRHQLEDLLRQIEDVKQTLPQLQGSVELNKSETISSLSKIRSQISDLDAEVRNQVLTTIQKQSNVLDRFQKDQEKLKEGLAQDIEQFEKINKENFKSFAAANKRTLEIVVQRLADLDETTKKSFENTNNLFITDLIPAMAKGNLDSRKAILEHLTKSRVNNEKSLTDLSEQNKILIEILGESLKQGAETKKQVTSLVTETKEQIVSINKTLVTTNNNLAVNNKNLIVADQKINKLAETLTALQVQHSVSSETLVTLKKGLVEAGEFDQLVDEKINKLVKNSAQLIANANKLEVSVLAELKQSSQKGDAYQDKINLANERLSRLIEILKAIAMEQGKLGKVVKAQAEMNKAQAGLVKNQESIKEALADLRRKANVSISRSDDIKKALGGITKNNSGASSKSTIKAKD